MVCDGHGDLTRNAGRGELRRVRLVVLIPTSHRIYEFAGGDSVGSGALALSALSNTAAKGAADSLDTVNPVRRYVFVFSPSARHSRLQLVQQQPNRRLEETEQGHASID